jgi:cobalamin biosynthesis protein CobT
MKMDYKSQFMFIVAAAVILDLFSDDEDEDDKDEYEDDEDENEYQDEYGYEDEYQDEESEEDECEEEEVEEEEDEYDDRKIKRIRLNFDDDDSPVRVPSPYASDSISSLSDSSYGGLEAQSTSKLINDRSIVA